MCNLHELADYVCCTVTLRAILVLFGGFLVHFTLGTIYTFGNMAPYIVSYIRNQSHPEDLEDATATWIYACDVAGIGCAMFFGGWLVNKIGPRFTTLLGSWIMSAGVVLSFIAIKVSIWLLLFTYGILYGMGVGVAYIGPLTSAMKWMPKWKGLANGVVVAGFGLGALGFNALQTVYINPHNVAPHPDPDHPEQKYFIDPDLIERIPWTFIIMGGCFAVIQLIGSLLITDPPPDYGSKDEPSKTGDTSPSMGRGDYREIDDKGSKVFRESDGEERKLLHPVVRSLTPVEVLKKPNFYILWFMLLCNGIAVIFTSTLWKVFGQEFIIDDHYFAAVGSVSAIFNCSGRIVWGLVADLVSYKFSLVIISAVMTMFLLTFYSTILGGQVMYFVWVCVIFFCIGGNFSLFPTAIGRAFGLKYAPVNYGMLFTSQIVAGSLGALLSTLLRSLIGFYGLMFLVSGFSCIGFILALVYKPKRYISLQYDNKD